MAVGYKIYLHTNTDQPERHKCKMMTTCLISDRKGFLGVLTLSSSLGDIYYTLGGLDNYVYEVMHLKSIKSSIHYSVLQADA
jgi:hypothetical protein